MSEWKTVILNDVLDILIDYRGKTPDKKTSGVALITAKIVKNGAIEKPSEFIAEEDYKDWMTRGIPEIGDVVLTTEAPLGEVAQLKYNHVALAQRIILLRGKKNILDNSFLKYYLQSYKGQQILKNRESGTTVTGIKQSELRKIEIDCPDFQTQRRIVDLLSCLDDKLDLNNRINGNLEQQTQAIFKEWFVDHAKPEWKEGKFTDLIDILGGGTPGTNEVSYWNGTIPFFTPKDVSTSCYIFSTEKNITEDGLHHCNSRLYPPETVFITARGTVGKVAIAGTSMAMNQSCYALQGKGCGQLFTYYETLNIVKILQNKANGAVFDAITTCDFESENIVIPDTEMLTKFEEKVKPLHTMMKNNCRENIRLEQIRNAILPKLMKGEINI
ncbi:MAG: restriction endonuclease subunit S [Treponema sp.]